MNNAMNEGEIQFSALLEQVEKSLRQKLYYVAIMTSLVIPDIGGAIDSENGKANRKKYVSWFDKLSDWLSRNTTPPETFPDQDKYFGD